MTTTTIDDAPDAGSQASSQQPSAPPPSASVATVQATFQLPPSSQPPAPPSSPAKKNFIWTQQDVYRFVSLIYDNESYQHVLLPSRLDPNKESEPPIKLTQTSVLRAIFKCIFPGQEVNLNRLKTKLSWIKTTYAAEHKKLGFTGAGDLLANMDHSHPVSVFLLCCCLGYVP